jgi:hypothetical protein
LFNVYCHLGRCDLDSRQSLGVMPGSASEIRPLHLIRVMPA